MKFIRYSLVCLICGLLITVTGCKKDHVTVVNTNSGVVIHSDDFTGGLKEKAAQHARKTHVEQIGKPSAKSSGNVIHLGDGYEKIELGPLFD